MKPKVTPEQIVKFVRRRNSSAHQSNLQFTIDADASGFKPTDLGKPQQISENHYLWDLPFGSLKEVWGRMEFLYTGGDESEN